MQTFVLNYSIKNNKYYTYLQKLYIHIESKREGERKIGVGIKIQRINKQREKELQKQIDRNIDTQTEKKYIDATNGYVQDRIQFENGEKTAGMAEEKERERDWCIDTDTGRILLDRQIDRYRERAKYIQCRYRQIQMLNS